MFVMLKMRCASKVMEQRSIYLIAMLLLEESNGIEEMRQE
jgi:hypothetical protein